MSGVGRTGVMFGDDRFRLAVIGLCALNFAALSPLALTGTLATLLPFAPLLASALVLPALLRTPPEALRARLLLFAAVAALTVVIDAAVLALTR